MDASKHRSSNGIAVTGKERSRTHGLSETTTTLARTDSEMQGGKPPKRPNGNRFEELAMDLEEEPDSGESQSKKEAAEKAAEKAARTTRANELVTKLQELFDPAKPGDTSKIRTDLLRTCKGLGIDEKMAPSLLAWGFKQNQIDAMVQGTK